MKSYIYREVKLSLQHSENFTEEGLIRAKKMAISMLDKGISPNSMHLIFCREGFICPGSIADKLILESRKISTGEGKFWVSKKKSANKHGLTILLMSFFILACFSAFKI
ncbi:hypothetical protein [Psychromonas antarctica]|jgi:hypothetical protein|uniref:hypothetical protein n=1 Tax=Psychromonas antarctica TaxID=67573 RepID=UPI001EE87893|nr:hypothetical protein [Psychromonas antarctica]MCG6199783.1 hypothetical protein [Psychromonas antarctica]